MKGKEGKEGMLIVKHILLGWPLSHRVELRPLCTSVTHTLSSHVQSPVREKDPSA